MQIIHAYVIEKDWSKGDTIPFLWAKRRYTDDKNEKTKVPVVVILKEDWDKIRRFPVNAGK